VKLHFELVGAQVEVNTVLLQRGVLRLDVT
jgi:hypothetical protein